MLKKQLSLLLSLLVIVMLGSVQAYALDAQSSQDDDIALADDYPAATVKDPYERFNRAMFGFNEVMDRILLKPVATAYYTFIPSPVQRMVHHFFQNIRTVPTVANDILQFNFYQATNDMWRLGINTTFGLAGFFDVASCIKLKPYENDFGLTLAKWGYKNSNYLVVPFWGPHTFRDAINLPVDYFAFSVYPYIKPLSTQYAIYGVGVIDRRTQLLKFQGLLDEAALDKYVFVRNAYLQSRAYEIEKNQHLSYKDRQQAEAPVTNNPGDDAKALEDNR